MKSLDRIAEASNELSSEFSIEDVGDIEQELALATKEHRAVKNLRILVLLLLGFVTLAVSTSVFLYSRSLEIETFESNFGEQAGKVVDAFQANAERRIGTLEAFSEQITSHAIHAGETFPNVTLPDFERRAAPVRKQAGVVALLVLPIVSTEQRAGWEDYSVTHQQWLMEGLALQESQRGDSGGGTLLAEDSDLVNDINGKFDDGGIVGEEEEKDIIQEMKISPVIFRIKPGTTDIGLEPGPGPFAPIWTISPAIPIPVMINLNTISHPTRYQEMQALLKEPGTLIASASDFNDYDPLTTGRATVMNLFLNRYEDGEFSYSEGPVSDIYLPIWSDFGEDQKMAAVLTGYVYWQSYFDNILPETAKGILAVLQNSCGQAFTYRIDGEDVTYLGKGDRHDSKYNDLGVETDYGAFLGEKKEAEETSDGVRCFYKLGVYPSQETEDDYLTNQPVVFTVVIVIIFVFTALVFCLYDYLVARRHHIVNTTAVNSTKVVSSLFPQEVRDRLYSSNEDKKSNKKLGLVSNAAGESATALDHGNEVDDSMPIADNYPDCTVFFSDIAGFTSWSSKRSPSEVFKLLETLYSAFDKIAAKRRVFKIETIGDCYVAVTGLPQAQPDHAIIMAKFAADCLDKTSDILHSLVDRLGEETAELSMRSGLHSGPVTAGVLRGDKARFQLFGDTVNVAARMESNGSSGRIHVSEATANLLIQGGKNDWVRKRDGLIQAKGKGSMQTYWVEPRRSCGVTNTTSGDAVGGGADSQDTNDIEDRLVSYLSKGQLGGTKLEI